MKHEQIKKFPRVNMSVDQFVRHIARFPGHSITRKKVELMQNGEFLGVWKKENGKMVRMHLKKIWIKCYTLPYRTTKTKNGKARIGREMLISSFPLPRGAVIR